jgi:hypothetical protein
MATGSSRPTNVLARYNTATVRRSLAGVQISCTGVHIVSSETYSHDSAGYGRHLSAAESIETAPVTGSPARPRVCIFRDAPLHVQGRIVFATSRVCSGTHRVIIRKMGVLINGNNDTQMTGKRHHVAS